MATTKQKKAVKEIVEKGRTSISAVMRDVGYSAKTAVDPSKLTNSIGFQELIGQYISDDDLGAKHKELLNAQKIVSARVTNKEANIDTDDFIEVPDYQTQIKAVELGYKIKDKMPREKKDITTDGKPIEQLIIIRDNNEGESL
jgi:hypothetical protein